MNTDGVYYTPSQRFYRGEISLKEATAAELEIARREERTIYVSSRAIRITLKVAFMVAFPIALLIRTLSRRNA